MALEIKSDPGQFASVHGDLLFVVNEATKANDPVTYPDYRYIADVMVSGQDTVRLKAYPQPDNKFGVFNIGNILRNYIAPVFNPLPNVLRCQLLSDGDFNVSGVVSIGEEYNFVLYPGIMNDGGRRYFGHYNGRMYGQSTILSDYYGKTLTSRPTNTPIYRNSSFHFLSHFEKNEMSNTQISTYSASGLQGSYTSDNAGVDFACRIYNISPAGINGTFPGAINDDTIYYTVKLEDDNTVYRFDLVCEPKYEVFSIHFLNKFGGFDSRDFTKVSRKVVDLEKKDFGKLPYTINPSGVPSYYNENKVYNETRSIYSTQYSEKLILNTDILTDGEYQWLAELILSPMVFIESNGYFIPAVITANNYEYRKTINDKKTNLTISVEFGEQFNSQYR